MIIPIAKDGSCFFRCVACFLNQDLLRSRRYTNGRLTNKNLREKENYISKFLRSSVVNLIEFEKEKYIQEIFYDSEIYDNIDDRIENMYNTNEWIGRLEIETLSNMFKIKFNIFILENNDSDENYIFSDSIGHSNYRVCNLILDENHYQLVVDDPEIDKIIEENKLVLSNTLTVNDIISEISSHSSTPIENERNSENIEDTVIIDNTDIQSQSHLETNSHIIENRPPTPFATIKNTDNQVALNLLGIEDLQNRVKKLENVSDINQNIINEISNSISVTNQLSELIKTLKQKYNIDSELELV
jgi:hypothetical protein